MSDVRARRMDAYFTERGATPRSWICRLCGADVDGAECETHARACLPVVRARDGGPDLRLVLSAEADHPANWLRLPATAPVPVYLGNGEWSVPRRFITEVVLGLMDEFGGARLERAK